MPRYSSTVLTPVAQIMPGDTICIFSSKRAKPTAAKVKAKFPMVTNGVRGYRLDTSAGAVFVIAGSVVEVPK